ncbi:zinc-binding protein A33-like [Engraulis encrasicolus]|uniref:zinc-binding protein A33-like n=1 Tax=Engraulis encrasicolus TaxID=184585 RepID=UPI002FD4E93F
MAQHIELQGDHTEAIMKQEFEKLHQFLRDEEAARIVELRTEELQKIRTLREKIENITRDIASLTDIISAIEETMAGDDISFLQNYHKIEEKVQCTLQNPEPTSAALIQVSQHLGNLKFNVWEKMQNIANYTPVILDPNTAHCRLSLSNDLTTVRFSETSMGGPPGPDRFDSSAVVLGSESFCSGSHSWDVKVGESSNWALGVMAESTPRRGNLTSGSGLWRIWYYNGQYRVGSTPGAPVLLTVEQKPQRIRVQLDWDLGQLSFFDPVHDVHLHTIDYTFTERVFPFINVTCEVSPLKIMPLKTSVTVMHHHAYL